ncbi:MAG: hypothetical protein MJ152_00890 [Clostridia bacterium]|nr:hypothetical protein [Clostridia bacterium]
MGKDMLITKKNNGVCTFVDVNGNIVTTVEGFKEGKVALNQIPHNYFLNQEFYKAIKLAGIQRIKKENPSLDVTIIEGKIEILKQRLFDIWLKAVEEHRVERKNERNISL